MAKDRANDPKRKPFIVHSDWDSVPSWEGPGSWESHQPVGEAWKKAYEENKANKKPFGRSNAFGD